VPRRIFLQNIDFYGYFEPESTAMSGRATVLNLEPAAIDH
jgi:hypothetical protein